MTEEKVLEIDDNEVPILKGYDRIYVVTEKVKNKSDADVFFETYSDSLLRYGKLLIVTRETVPELEKNKVETIRYKDFNVYLIGRKGENDSRAFQLGLFIVFALIMFVSIIGYFVMVIVAFLWMRQYMSVAKAFFFSLWWPYSLAYRILYNHYPGSNKLF